MSKAFKKKGLSIEEKLCRIEEWFVSHPAPYTLKDLMVVLPRETGVVQQSVEECLEVLVSENAVQQKKVGTHVLFWRFPKTATQQLAASIGGGGMGDTAGASKYLNMSLEEIQAEFDMLGKREVEVLRCIQEARAAVGEEAVVRDDAETMKCMQSKVKALQTQLDHIALFDPLMVDKIKVATTVALEAANRWTDNLCLLEHHISQRMGLSTHNLRAQLQLPQDIDYLEYDDLLPSGGNGVKSAAVLEPEECPSMSSSQDVKCVTPGGVDSSAAYPNPQEVGEGGAPGNVGETKKRRRVGGEAKTTWLETPAAQVVQGAEETNTTQPTASCIPDASAATRSRKQTKKARK